MKIHSSMTVIRKNLKMTQSEAAKLVGISRSHYTNIEAGRRSPSPKTAQKIGKVFGFNWINFFIKGGESDNYCARSLKKTGAKRRCEPII